MNSILEFRKANEAAANTGRRFNRDDLVQTMFNTGAMGLTVLYGRVVASGPKTATVLWESNLTNRIRHDQSRVGIAKDQAEASRAMNKALNRRLATVAA